LLGVVSAYHNLVAPYINIWCGIYPKRRVAVGPATCPMAVDIDLGVHINAFEVEAYLLALVGLA
jgi:hypothetical protein